MTRGLRFDTLAYRQRVQHCMETEDDGMIACRRMLVVEDFLIGSAMGAFVAMATWLLRHLLSLTLLSWTPTRLSRWMVSWRRDVFLVNGRF